VQVHRASARHALWGVSRSGASPAQHVPLHEMEAPVLTLMSSTVHAALHRLCNEVCKPAARRSFPCHSASGSGECVTHARIFQRAMCTRTFRRALGWMRWLYIFPTACILAPAYMCFQRGCVHPDAAVALIPEGCWRASAGRRRGLPARTTPCTVALHTPLVMAALATAGTAATVLYWTAASAAVVSQRAHDALPTQADAAQAAWTRWQAHAGKAFLNAAAPNGVPFAACLGNSTLSAFVPGAWNPTDKSLDAVGQSAARTHAAQDSWQCGAPVPSTVQWMGSVQLPTALPLHASSGPITHALLPSVVAHAGTRAVSVRFLRQAEGESGCTAAPGATRHLETTPFTSVHVSTATPLHSTGNGGEQQDAWSMHTYTFAPLSACVSVVAQRNATSPHQGVHWHSTTSSPLHAVDSVGCSAVGPHSLLPRGALAAAVQQLTGLQWALCLAAHTAFNASSGEWSRRPLVGGGGDYSGALCPHAAVGEHSATLTFFPADAPYTAVARLQQLGAPRHREDFMVRVRMAVASIVSAFTLAICARSVCCGAVGSRELHAVGARLGYEGGTVRAASLTLYPLRCCCYRDAVQSTHAFFSAQGTALQQPTARRTTLVCRGHAAAPRLASMAPSASTAPAMRARNPCAAALPPRVKMKSGRRVDV